MGDWPLCGDNARYFASGRTDFTVAHSNLKGPWNEVVASLPVDVQACWIYLYTATSQCLIDIGIGPAGSEQVIIPDLYISQEGGGADVFMKSFFLPLFILKGTRLAVRGQCDHGSLDQNAHIAILFLGRSFKYFGIQAQKIHAFGIDSGAALLRRF